MKILLFQPPILGLKASKDLDEILQVFRHFIYPTHCDTGELTELFSCWPVTGIMTGSGFGLLRITRCGSSRLPSHLWSLCKRSHFLPLGQTLSLTSYLLATLRTSKVIMSRPQLRATRWTAIFAAAVRIIWELNYSSHLHPFLLDLAQQRARYNKELIQRKCVA